MSWCTYPRNETLVHLQFSLHQLHHLHPSRQLPKQFFGLRDVTRSIYLCIKSLDCQCVPKTSLPAKMNLPWLSKELTKSIRAKNLAYKCAKRTGASQHFLSYKCKRNEVDKLMRKAKRKFFRGLNTPNSKNFWKVAKFLSKKNSGIATLENGERVVGVLQDLSS